MQVHTKYVDWPLCVTIFPLCDRSIEGGALCKLRIRLLVATISTSVHSKQGAPFQNSRRQQENTYSFEESMQNERDSKPSVKKKPNIGKWPSVGPLNIKSNLRLTE